MRRIIKVIFEAARETPFEYFIPIIGAVRGIKREYRLLDRIERMRNAKTTKL